MGLFEKKDSVSRAEMRSALRKTSIDRLGTGGKKYAMKERIGFEKEVFPRMYGEKISKGEYKAALGYMKKSKLGKTYGERLKIERKINELKKFGGV